MGQLDSGARPNESRGSVVHSIEGDAPDDGSSVVRDTLALQIFGNGP